MSVRTKRANLIRKQARSLYRREATASTALRKRYYWSKRWALMLWHEFVVDDVQLRAESLAFLMLFSLMPLIAGCFFIFTIFAQFGMVQTVLSDFTNRFLETIPSEHRTFVLDYILKFKDAYLHSMSSQSGSIGIFALFILIWVGVKAYGNVDRTLNFIWSSDRERPVLENIRNFLMISIVAPLVLVSALSVPLILKQAPVVRDIFARIPVLLGFIDLLIVPAFLLATFAALYKFVPVRRVKWRSALMGGGVVTVCLLLCNYFMGLYFRFGTQSAYGKAAVVPLIGFWIYLVWIVVIMGAEVSFLIQNEKDVLNAADWDPTLREGEALLLLLLELYSAHRQGTNPVDFERLRTVTSLDSLRLRALLFFLETEGIVLEGAASKGNVAGKYLLAKSLDGMSLSTLLGDLYRDNWSSGPNPASKVWVGGLEHSLAQYKQVGFIEFANRILKR